MNEAEGITLERYAEIRAHLRHREGEGESRVLSRLGVDRPRWEIASVAWAKALDEDADGPGELVVVFATAFADARRKLKDEIPATLEAPVLELATAPLAVSAPIAMAPLAIAPPAITPPPVVSPSPDPDELDPLAETAAIRVDRRPPPTLPFAQGAAPPIISEASPAMPKVNRAPAALTGTGNVDPRAIAAAVTPFDKKKPPPATPAPLPARPAHDAHLGAGGVPALTLEQYASLTAELTVSPERTAEIRARYQVGAEDVFQRLVRGFQARFAADPELKARIVALSAQYREWLSQKKSG